MNPFAEALNRAVKYSNRESFNAAFERELEDLQFADGAESVVLPVPMRAALLWSEGKFSDLELLLSINGQAEAVWWPILPNIRQFPAGLEEARKHFTNGARILITHTSNPIVRGHVEKWGAIETHKNESGARLLLDENGFARYWEERHRVKSKNRALGTLSAGVATVPP